jgi:hypothetical protein
MRKPHEIAIIDRAIGIALGERNERDPDETNRLNEKIMSSEEELNRLVTQANNQENNADDVDMKST